MVPDSSKIVCTDLTTTQASGDTTSTYVDTRGFDFASVMVISPAPVATNSSAKYRAFGVYWADSTTFATTNAIAVGTTNSTAAAGEFVMAAQNDTAIANVVAVDADLRGRGRYLHIKWGAPAATDYTTNCVVTRLTRAEGTPVSTSARGVAGYGAG